MKVLGVVLLFSLAVITVGVNSDVVPSEVASENWYSVENGSCISSDRAKERCYLRIFTSQGKTQMMFPWLNILFFSLHFLYFILNYLDYYYKLFLFLRHKNFFCNILIVILKIPFCATDIARAMLTEQ